MARQWRIEFPGALYHVISRGNGRQDIFNTDKDRHLFLALLEDLLIYLLWKTGRLSNREIGVHFGLTHSAVSRCVKTMRGRILTEPTLSETFQAVKSQIKV